MDALEGFGEHGADTQQRGALGGPVARRARAVLLPGDDQERHSVRPVAHRGVVQELLLAVGKMNRVRSLAALDEPVSQSDIAERPADHDLVMAASRPVGVEFQRSHAVRLEPLARG